MSIQRVKEEKATLEQNYKDEPQDKIQKDNKELNKAARSNIQVSEEESNIGTKEQREIPKNDVPKTPSTIRDIQPDTNIEKKEGLTDNNSLSPEIDLKVPNSEGGVILKREVRGDSYNPRDNEASLPLSNAQPASKDNKNLEQDANMKNKGLNNEQIEESTLKVLVEMKSHLFTSVGILHRNIFKYIDYKLGTSFHRAIEECLERSAVDCSPQSASNSQTVKLSGDNFEENQE